MARCRLPISVPIPVLFIADGDRARSVFGICRPVLILPEGMLDAHVARVNSRCESSSHELPATSGGRDNLTAALHMVVQALFWFHPLVWFDRERA